MNKDEKSKKMLEERAELLKQTPFSVGDFITQKEPRRYKLPAPGDPALVIGTFSRTFEEPSDGSQVKTEDLHILVDAEDGEGDFRVFAVDSAYFSLAK